MGAYGSPDLSQEQWVKEKPKKKKPFYRRWWFIVMLIIFIFFFIGSYGNEKAGLNEVDNSSVPISVPVDEIKIVKVGDIVETESIRAIATGIEKPEGDQFNTPTEGNEFVLINLKLENTSNSDISISSMLNFNAYVDDVALTESFLAQMARKGTNTVGGTIAPGKKIIGALSYEVPKDWKYIEVHFKSKIYEDTEIKWIIENK